MAGREAGRGRVPDNTARWEASTPAVMKKRMPCHHVAGHSKPYDSQGEEVRPWLARLPSQSPNQSTAVLTP